MGKSCGKPRPKNDSADSVRMAPATPHDAATVTAFLRQHDPRIVGLVGSDEQIAAAMAAFRIEAHRIPTGGDSYQLDHPAIFFLMGPQGRYVRSFPSSGDPAVLAEEIRGAIDASTDAAGADPPPGA